MRARRGEWPALHASRRRRSGIRPGRSADVFVRSGPRRSHIHRFGRPETRRRRRILRFPQPVQLAQDRPGERIGDPFPAHIGFDRRTAVDPEIGLLREVRRGFRSGGGSPAPGSSRAAANAAAQSRILFMVNRLAVKGYLLLRKSQRFGLVVETVPLKKKFPSRSSL